MTRPLPVTAYAAVSPNGVKLYASTCANEEHETRCAADFLTSRAGGYVVTPVTIIPTEQYEAMLPQRMRGIYVASKTKYADEWKALKTSGYPIVSTWIYEAKTYETLDWPDLWQRCITEASLATALVLICRKGDVLKGAWAEAGAALSAGRRVYAAGCEEFTIRHHPNFIICASEAEAFAGALAALKEQPDAQA